jgi:hypothetical protein
MWFLFHSPSWVFSSLLVVVPTIIFFISILLFIRKRVSIEVLRKHHDVAGFTFSMIGILYSVILGFTVVKAQERYNGVAKTALTEAFMLADLYRDAAFFPSKDKNLIRSQLRQYINYVTKEEWGKHPKKAIPLKSRHIVEELWRSYYDVDIENKKTRIWYRESISKLDDFMNATLARQFSALDHLGGIMWTLLIVGGVITVCFMFFFGLENLCAQMIMTGLLAGYLSFILFLVYTLDNVFTEPAAIKPTSLEQVGILFDRWDEETQISSEK